NTGTAWMSWLTDQVGAGAAGQAKVYDTSDFANITYVELFGYLHPTTTFFYMQEVPEKDGWRYPLGFGKNPDPLDSNVIIICSTGRDGSAEGACHATQWNVAPFVSTDYGKDIVWADGYLVSWPGQVN
ncbi:MAG: hypothetical protein V3T72_23085, partial [Thermoanaerobaculia bacterium]